MNNAEVFEKIYTTCAWGVWPASGSGSTKHQTSVLSAKLPQVIDRLGVKSILDCGCGDLNWMPDVDLCDCSYIGYDVSPSVVGDLKRRFPDKDLRVGDICDDKLPPADLALCRDVLVHLPFEKIWDFLRNLKKNSVKYLATTSFTGRSVNSDCSVGDWRTLNFEVAPFNFPIPEIALNERLGEHDPNYYDKSTCVWAVDSLLLT